MQPAAHVYSAHGSTFLRQSEPQEHGPPCVHGAGSAGAGWVGGTGTDPDGARARRAAPGEPVGACYYTASGSLEDETMTLVGRSLLTNRALALADTEDPGKSDTRADGRDFNTTVNLETGFVDNGPSPPREEISGAPLLSW